MKEILNASIVQIKNALLNKTWSAEEVTRAHLDQIERVNHKINAFITLNDKAIERAQLVDKKIVKGQPLLALEGIPMGVKDMLCTKGLRTTAASKILDNFVPPYSATVVKKLESAGAILLGKCNQDEFAMGSTNESSAAGPCLNPWNVEYVAGGSSGGSAAAVCAGMVAFSIGTDTGGSVRQPAHCCGVVGLKPTYGRVSRYGVVAFASSLDQVGPMGKSVEDVALVMEQICGYDPFDSTSSRRSVPEWSKNLRSNLKGYKVGLLTEDLLGPIHSDVEKKIDTCVDIIKSAGGKVMEVSVPHMRYSVPVYYLVATSEASSNLARYDGVRFGYRCDFSSNPPKDMEDFYSRNRGEGFGREVKRRLILGTYALSYGHYDDYYLKACKVRRLLYNEFVDIFRQCDVILSPVMTHLAYKRGEREKALVKVYFNDILTTPANLVGLPAMSVPVGLSQEGLPIGVQLMTSHFQEQKVLDVALALESQSGFKEQRVHVL